MRDCVDTPSFVGVGTRVRVACASGTSEMGDWTRRGLTSLQKERETDRFLFLLMIAVNRIRNV